MNFKNQIGKRNFSKEAEEEQYKDILLFMELLTNLLSKDFIDLSPPESQVQFLSDFLYFIFTYFWYIAAQKNCPILVRNPTLIKIRVAKSFFLKFVFGIEWNIVKRKS